MNPAKRDKRITVERPTGAADAANQQTGATVVVFSGRAMVNEVEGTSTREENRNDNRIYADARVFNIRYCQGYFPQPTDVIEYMGGSYDIYQIIGGKRERQWELKAERRSIGGNSITQEGA